MSYDELELIQEYIATIFQPNDKPIQIRHLKNTQFPKKILERLNLFKQFTLSGVKYNVMNASDHMYISRLSPNMSLSKYKMKNLGGNKLYVIIAIDNRCKFMIYDGMRVMPSLTLDSGELHLSSQLNIINIQTSITSYYITFYIDIQESVISTES